MKKTDQQSSTNESKNPEPDPVTGQQPTRSQRLADAGYTRRPSWKSLPGAIDGDDEAQSPAERALTDVQIADLIPDEQPSVRMYVKFARAVIAAAQLQPKGTAVIPIQGGMSNLDLALHWNRKLPGVKATDDDLRAFALGIEVGMERERLGKAEAQAPATAPVAWRYRPGVSWPWVLSDDSYEVSCKRDKGYQVEGLAVAQAPAPAHGPLTSEAILDLAEPMRHLLKGANDWALVREFGRAVERAALAAISSPAVQDGKDARDAARYRFIRDADRCDEAIDFDTLLGLAMESMDAAIDDAMGREASSFDVPVQGSQS